MTRSVAAMRSRHGALENEVKRLQSCLRHFRNRLLAYAPLADDMITEIDAVLVVNTDASGNITMPPERTALNPPCPTCFGRRWVLGESLADDDRVACPKCIDTSDV